MNDDLIGRTLRALRHRRGWRQSDLAATAGVAWSVIGDLEAGRLDGHTLDRKTRLASTVARERSWRASRVVPALLILDGSTARRRLVEHAPLFTRFELRGRAAVAWMRNPEGRPAHRRQDRQVAPNRAMPRAHRRQDERLMLQPPG